MKTQTIAMVVLAFVLASCTGAPPVATPTAAAPTATATAIATAAPSPTPLPTLSPAISPRPVQTPSGPLFSESLTLEVAGDPIGVDVADFNGDGVLDIVTVNWDGTASVLLGVGGREFGEHIDVPTGEGFPKVAAVDLNGDSSFDFVAVPDNLLVAFVASDEGTFESIAQTLEFVPSELASGDLNGDGKADLAMCVGGIQVYVLLGEGDGHFATPVGYPIEAPYSSGISVADFNGDGKLDLVTADSRLGRGESARLISLLLGAGDGTFAAPLTQHVSGNQPVLPVVADFNRDGFLDVATPNGGGARDVSVLLGLGDGTFAPSVQYATGMHPHSLVAADLNGDGNIDLATGNPAGGEGPSVYVLFGAGDGTFVAPIGLRAEDVGLAETLGSTVDEAADLDGDGKADLVLITNFGIQLLFNDIAR